MPRSSRKPGPKPILKRPVQRWVQFEQGNVRRAEKFCARQGISFAALLRTALRDYLEKHGDE